MKTLTDFRKTVETGVDPRLNHDRTSEHQANLTKFFIKTHYILH